MKNNGTTTILNWAIILGAAFLLVAAVRFYNKSKNARAYQALIGQINNLQNSEGIVKGLVAESIEYAKTHPAINPVLDPIIGKQSPGPATTGATKPTK
jgi:uncharacterized membrane protein